jgi:hypothetical protein
MTIFLEWVRSRIRMGFSPIVLIVGKQRQGKTCMALRMAYEIDPNFDVKKQMFFDVITYAKAVDKYKRKILILDEAGIELDTYRFSDVRQRCFSHLIQSQAYKQNTLFIVLPHASDLAKCHRKHVDSLMVIPFRGSYIFYSPRVAYYDMNEINFMVKKIEHILQVPLPPSHLFNEYKTQYEKQIKQDILEKEIDKLDAYLKKKVGKPEQNIITVLK